MPTKLIHRYEFTARGVPLIGLVYETQHGTDGASHETKIGRDLEPAFLTFKGDLSEKACPYAAIAYWDGHQIGLDKAEAAKESARDTDIRTLLRAIEWLLDDAKGRGIDPECAVNAEALLEAHRVADRRSK